MFNKPHNKTSDLTLLPRRRIAEYQGFIDISTQTTFSIGAQTIASWTITPKKQTYGENEKEVRAKPKKQLDCDLVSEAENIFIEKECMIIVVSQEDTDTPVTE